MKKLRVSAAAAGLSCGALLLAGAPTVPVANAAPAAPRAAAAPVETTPFGYKGVVFGTKVVESGTQIRTLKDAELHRQCTRQVGLTKESPSLLSFPLENDLIELAAINSETQTYKEGPVYGVRATSTIGDIALGGMIGDVPTPKLVIEGLVSVADSYVDTSKGDGKFGETHDFTFGGISLELPEEGPLPSEELQQLIDIIEEATTPIEDVVNQVVDLLTEVGQIEIPGLGSISLGGANGEARENSAHAEAYALRIVVQPNEETAPTVLQLGRAASRISRPVKAGVFRSNMGALEGALLNDTLTFGGIEPRNLPCEGTHGNTRTHTVPTAGVLGGLALTMNGIEYAYAGDQDGKEAHGWARTTIDSVEIPAVGLLIEDIKSRVAVESSGPDRRVKRNPTASVGSITVDGASIPVPKPGKTAEFDGGVIRVKVLKQSTYYGVRVVGVEVVLTELDATIELGNTTNGVFFR